MGQFLGTHHNRLDAKGRVSIPALFRNVLKAQAGTEGAAGVRLVLRPSHNHPCIEAWPEREFEALAEPLGRLEQFSEDYEDFAAALYNDAYPVESDKEGRIVLPESIAAHAGLGEAVCFMGQGRNFQIWEPAAAEQRRAQARERARERKLTLPGASK